MPTILSLPETSPSLPKQKIHDQQQRGRSLVLFAAGVALISKLMIAWNTFGTNDVASFYHFGKSLSQRGLEWTYMSDVAFNHPPLVAGFLRGIYELDHLPWSHANGIAFPL